MKNFSKIVVYDSFVQSINIHSGGTKIYRLPKKIHSFPKDTWMMGMPIDKELWFAITQVWFLTHTILSYTNDVFHYFVLNSTF